MCKCASAGWTPVFCNCRQQAWEGNSLRRQTAWSLKQYFRFSNVHCAMPPELRGNWIPLLPLGGGGNKSKTPPHQSHSLYLKTVSSFSSIHQMNLPLKVVPSEAPPAIAAEFPLVTPLLALTATGDLPSKAVKWHTSISIPYITSGLVTSKNYRCVNAHL